MVGIVIVSHSRQLAEGVRELAAQMAQGRVALAIAAGIDDPDNPLGTDALQVQQAIESVYDPSGVVVLMDLGSAVLSAEMAVEFLAAEQQSTVYLCEAPLVEGTIAATVAAAAGGSIEQVLAEARSALSAKAAQFQQTQNAGTDDHAFLRNEPPSIAAEAQQQIRLTVRNRFGLHARPAAQFVTTVARFQSQIQVQNATRQSDFRRADSINQVMMLGVRQGDELVIVATGTDADAAIEALQTLVEANFGEEESALLVEAIPPQRSASQADLQGIAASPGVAIAPGIRLEQTLQLPDRASADPATEWQHLQTALSIVQQGIQTLHSTISSEAAAIFEAHQLFLSDPTVLEAVQQRITEQQMSAAAAWQATVDDMVSAYQTQEDAYLQARAIDAIDVGQQVLRQLLGSERRELELPHPAILIATDLTPSDTAQLDPTQVVGLCTAQGSSTSHTAILARSIGIPAVVGMGTNLLKIPAGACLGLDGETGEVWIDPTATQLDQLRAKQSTWQLQQQQLQQVGHRPAITQDGQPIVVLANIATVAEAHIALKAGAEGIGLLRTEFLYLDRTTAPSEEEQVAVYQAIAQATGPHPLIIRTLDAGGDKPLPYLHQRPEMNPFLGQRGIRVGLEQVDLFKTQLRAILRASPGHQFKLMFPMIASLPELKAAKRIVAEVQTELHQAGIAFDETIPIGIMVEVPSAVVIADQLAVEVEFFSIGTNDLSQYVMAADRTNPTVSALADALHPAVLRSIQQTVQAADRAGIWVGVCGEIAADPMAVPILLGLGLDELSVNSQAIPGVKQTIAQLSLSQAVTLANQALQQESAVQVRAIAARFVADCLGE